MLNFFSNKPKSNNDSTSILHELLLEVILMNANRFDKNADYCQLRDSQNNGWDIFYFGFGYQERKAIKNCYAQLIVNGAHAESRVYFTKEDTQKILDSIGDIKDPNISMTIYFGHKK
jgi:hypothetical protein